MISDEPDEDAEYLDDEAVLDTYVDNGPSRLTDAAQTAPDLPDWPAPVVQDNGLNLDAGTLAWFKSKHADWQHEIRSVLRAWAATNAREQGVPMLRLTSQTVQEGRTEDRPSHE